MSIQKKRSRHQEFVIITETRGLNMLATAQDRFKKTKTDSGYHNVNEVVYHY